MSLSLAAERGKPAGDRHGRGDRRSSADGSRWIAAADLRARPARTVESNTDGRDHSGGRSRKACDIAGIAALEAPPGLAGDEVWTGGQTRAIISFEITRLHPLGDLVPARSPVSFPVLSGSNGTQLSASF